MDEGLTPAEFVRQQLKITDLDTKKEKMKMEKEEAEAMEQKMGNSFSDYVDFISIVHGIV